MLRETYARLRSPSAPAPQNNVKMSLEILDFYAAAPHPLPAIIGRCCSPLRSPSGHHSANPFYCSKSDNFKPHHLRSPSTPHSAPH